MAAASSSPAAAAAASAQKVYWVGRHAVVPEMGSPVSKIHKEGLQLLKSMGWTQVQNDTACVPVFAFTTRKGANYPADKPGLPVVRQLPQSCTACLDDKRSMAQHLTAAGLQHLMPPCWDDIEAFLAAQQQQQQHGQSQEQQHQPEQAKVAEQVGPPQQEQQQEETEQEEEPLHDAVRRHLLQLDPWQAELPGSAVGVQPAAAAPIGLSGTEQSQGADKADTSSSSSSSSSDLLPVGSVFVKHRQGAKGQAVYVARTMQQLLQLQQRLQGSSNDFVVQQEVPPLLLQGCKFVMRVHVLAVLQLPQQQKQQQQHGVAVGDELAAVCVYLHEDVVVLQHAKQYDSASDDSAVHISSRGKQGQPPVLLAHSLLPTDLQRSIWQQLQGLAVRSLRAVSHVMLPAEQEVHPGVVLYHLFGFDCMVDASGLVLLLEVNSYPAVASGTMSRVDAGVYTRLIGDLVRLLVLPIADGLVPDPGGFVEVT